MIVLHDLTELRRLEMVRRDFVANVSHELKTPLTVDQRLRRDAARRRSRPEQRRRFVETIRGNADRMQRIVDDLLDLSRIEVGRWRPSPSTVDVAAVGARRR